MPSALLPRRGMPRHPLTRVAVAGILGAAVAGCSGPAAEIPEPTAQTFQTQTRSTSAESTPSITTPPLRTLREGFQAALPAIVRIDRAGCTVGSGLGFAVAPDLVVTAAHVVDDARQLRVTNHLVTTTGSVVGIDRAQDVAVVRIGRKTAGTLTFVKAAPTVSDNVIVLGAKPAQGVGYTAATIDGLDRAATVAGQTHKGLLSVDAALALGDAGSPVVDAAGGVVGMLLTAPATDPEGGRLAVPAATLSGLVSQWSSATDPDPSTAGKCTTVWQPDATPYQGTATDEQAAAATTLAIYFDAVRAKDYETALAQLAKPPKSANFIKALGTAQYGNFALHALGQRDGHPTVQLSFTSEQEPGDGPPERPDESCTLWSLEYDFAKVDGIWKLGDGQGIDGQAKNQPCETGD